MATASDVTLCRPVVSRSTGVSTGDGDDLDEADADAGRDDDDEDELAAASKSFKSKSNTRSRADRAETAVVLPCVESVVEAVLQAALSAFCKLLLVIFLVAGDRSAKEKYIVLALPLLCSLLSFKTRCY